MSSYEIPGQAEIVQPGIPLDDVLALQSLAMGTVRKFARSKSEKRTPDKSTAFVLFHSTPNSTDILDHFDRLAIGEPEPTIYRGENGAEIYTQVLIVKPEPRKWKLSVSFIYAPLSEEKKSLEHTRSRFSFNWNLGDKTATGLQKYRTIRLQKDPYIQGTREIRIEESACLDSNICATLSTLILNQLELAIGLGAGQEEDAA